MFTERRKVLRPPATALNRELNPAQAAALVELEHFGWELKFVRHPLFQDAVPVVFDPDRTHFAVLKADGTLDEHPPFPIRH
jgi:hypothetical protein